MYGLMAIPVIIYELETALKTCMLSKFSSSNAIIMKLPYKDISKLMYTNKIFKHRNSLKYLEVLPDYLSIL